MTADILFPSDLYEIENPDIAIETDISKFLTLNAARMIKDESDPELLLDRSERGKSTIAIVKQSLTPREWRVISERFGLEGDDEKTLRDIGVGMGVGGTRIMQIEAKANR